MRIGELSERTGVKVRLLRYYEEQNLLHPVRLPSGYRVYEEADVDRVRRIRGLLAAGLGTSTIHQVIACIGDDGERLVPTCPTLIGELQAERARIDQAIGDLASSRDLLNSLIAASPAGEEPVPL